MSTELEKAKIFNNYHFTAFTSKEYLYYVTVTAHQLINHPALLQCSGDHSTKCHEVLFQLHNSTCPLLNSTHLPKLLHHTL